MSPPELYLGLISGTSTDAVDAALVEVTSPRDTDFEARLVGWHEHPYPPALRTRVLALSRGEYLSDPIDEMMKLDRDLGELFAVAAQELLATVPEPDVPVRAVGFHGQTVRHRPSRSEGAAGTTLQLGCAATVVERLGCSVVGDLRRRDLVLGGEGAPLVPLVDRLLLARSAAPVVAINLGGIANLSWLPPRGDPAPVMALDTGPANCWMDAVCRRLKRSLSYDEGGALARSGQVDLALLSSLRRHPYLARPAPKSTGPEEFRPEAVAAMLGGRGVADVVATLSQFTAETVAEGIRTLGHGRPRPAAVFVSGGGAANPDLVSRLVAAYPEAPFEDLEAVCGVPAAAKEAFAFAVLAARHVHGLPGNEPGATGAREATVLGALTPA